MRAAWKRVQVVAAALLCAGAALAQAADASAQSAGVLRAKYAELRSQFDASPFGKPIHLESSESADSLTGDIHALVDHPFAVAAAALHGPRDWCDVLTLHVNIKYCRASAGGESSVLDVRVGRKHGQPLDEAYRLAFTHRVAAQAGDYLQVRLNAEQGPLSTHDYRIVLEAIPVDGGRTFIHLSYAYGFGVAGRLAMQAYLGTLGKGKVGFTVVGTQADGRPRYIGGTRGVVERNTMRYYLAIESFLGALSAPPQARLEKRLRDWHAASERYARQLHELEQGEYLEMKRKEHLRVQTGRRTTRVGPDNPSEI